MADKSVLLEIGVEEIPARFIPGALRELGAITSSVLEEARLGFDDIRTYATPRRLAVVVEGLLPVQKDRVREAFGPPVQAAFDSGGKPTKAALGFARAQGVAPSLLVVRKKEKGEYVAAVIEEKGRPAREILPELLRKIIISLSFPKSMRWGHGSIRFARPIHWVAALLGGRAVTFELDGIKSGSRSRGHRFLSPGEFSLRNPGEYVEKLRDRYVVADLGERIESIRGQAMELALSVKGTPVADEELLSIVACLVEYPVCVLGGFSEKYLELPAELLTAVMVGHQKYIPVKGPDGRLKNSFIVVSNTMARNADIVRAGAERVIRPRFDDARFYFEEDRKRKLVDRLEDLKRVTFQEKLGTLRDKTSRLMALSGALSGALCPDKRDTARRAAELSKADLITGVAREFPELQGVMGMYYARMDGEKEEVSRALMEQYLPGFSGDRVPETDAGTVLGLADRLDNLASFFSIGLKPTGSEDPFALRRQALGIISILTEGGYGLSIREVLKPALAGVSPSPGVEAELLGFFRQRLEHLLDSQGYEYDLVQSVTSRSTEVPVKDVYKRLDAIKWFKSHAEYNDFLIAVKRVNNIIPAGELQPADAALLKEDEERKLYSALASVRSGVTPLLDGADFRAALEGLLSLTGPVNVFFDRVLVMDKDEKVRMNRLSLLKEIWTMAFSVADFSKLQERA